jgi:preprotein translocase subunit SecG
METVVLIVHVLISAGLIGLVLLQQGKGADMGAAFGSGASGTVFGSRGSGSFLTRGTAILATLFFATSLWLAYFSGKGVVTRSVTEMAKPAVEEQAPAAADMPAAPMEIPGKTESDVPETK